MKLTGFFGAILLMMYLAALSFANGGTNPIIDSHIIQALLIVLLALTYSTPWGLDSGGLALSASTSGCAKPLSKVSPI